MVKNSLVEQARFVKTYYRGFVILAKRIYNLLDQYQRTHTFTEAEQKLFDDLSKQIDMAIQPDMDDFEKELKQLERAANTIDD